MTLAAPGTGKTTTVV
jgi:hypothetical protein